MTNKNSEVRITKTVVEGLPANRDVRDSIVKGFGARRRAGPGVSYFVQRRVNGRMVRVTIGPHGSPWTAETARKEAQRILGDMVGGENPNHSKREQRVLGASFQAAADDFLDLHVSKLKPKTVVAYRSLFKTLLLPAFKNIGVNDIDAAAVEKAHRKWKAKPRSANHALTVLGKMLNWSVERGLRKGGENPVRSVKRYREKKRERYLTREELGRLGQALRELEAERTLNPYAAAAVRLLLYTGARRDEILTLKWEYVDRERKLLALPDSKTGEKYIVLDEAAIEVLDEIPRLENNPYVIVGRKHGQRMVNLSKPWIEVRKKAKLEGVRLHDLRHSFASVAAGLGASLPMIGKALGHSQPQTTARYSHLTEDPVRDMVSRTARHMRTAMEEEPLQGQHSPLPSRGKD